MTAWGDLRRARPDLADAGVRLLYQFGVGLAFLATVRRDGGPRVHPICPIVTDEEVYGFLEPSPKLRDLHRDPRYALHSFPPADNEDAFYVTGDAWPVPDHELIQVVTAQLLSERGWKEPPPTAEVQELFRFDIDRCLHTRTTGHGDFAPRHEIWRAA